MACSDHPSEHSPEHSRDTTRQRDLSGSTPRRQSAPPDPGQRLLVALTLWSTSPLRLLRLGLVDALATGRGREGVVGLGVVVGVEHTTPLQLSIAMQMVANSLTPFP